MFITGASYLSRYALYQVRFADTAFAVHTLRNALVSGDSKVIPLDAGASPTASPVASHTPNHTPAAKRVCNVNTPEAMKDGQLRVKTPSSSARELTFSKNIDKKSSCIRVVDVPHPFLEVAFKDPVNFHYFRASSTIYDFYFFFLQKTFITSIEKLRMKKGISTHIKSSIVSCHDYNKGTKSVIVEVSVP